MSSPCTLSGPLQLKPAELGVTPPRGAAQPRPSLTSPLRTWPYAAEDHGLGRFGHSRDIASFGDELARCAQEVQSEQRRGVGIELPTEHTGFDTTMQDAFHESSEFLLVAANPLLHCGRKAGPGDRSMVAVCGGGHLMADEERQLGFGTANRHQHLPELHDSLGEMPFICCRHDRLHICKVVVERLTGNTRPLGDGRHRHPGDAAFGYEPERGRDYALLRRRTGTHGLR